MMAGSDFIKTSTGKESVNAIIPVGIVMARAIKEYYEKMGYKVIVKHNCIKFVINSRLSLSKNKVRHFLLLIFKITCIIIIYSISKTSRKKIFFSIFLSNK